MKTSIRTASVASRRTGRRAGRSTTTPSACRHDEHRPARAPPVELEEVGGRVGEHRDAPRRVGAVESTTRRRRSARAPTARRDRRSARRSAARCRAAPRPPVRSSTPSKCTSQRSLVRRDGDDGRASPSPACSTAPGVEPLDAVGDQLRRARRRARRGPGGCGRPRGGRVGRVRRRRVSRRSRCRPRRRRGWRRRGTTVRMLCAVRPRGRSRGRGRRGRPARRARTLAAAVDRVDA